MKIVLSVVLAMLIAGCSDEKKSENVSATAEAAKEVQTVQKQPVQTRQNDAMQKVAAVQKAIETKKLVVVEKVTKDVPQTKTVDGAKLFTACSSCHGAHAEKKALGKSQIIKGWDKTKIITALKGYKDGTYGGAMKAVMKGQATKLSDADIKALAEYISQL
ncbi:c-type cytochrome [Sulfurimonas sp. NW9]|uniref:c-type cytochrome n=1 Tax=Sulfurimonas sp. NW9 TaxID=2922728 RepID=UPI003DA9863E